MSVCIHNIITDLEILVQGHLLGKKSLVLIEVMDRHGSAVTTVSHRAHSKMKELSVKLHRKRGDCLASGFVLKASGCSLSQDTRDQVERTESHMGSLDGRETRCLYSKIQRHSSTASDKS